jgi:hypothetical protein
MKRLRKTHEKIGYHLLVQERTQDGSRGKFGRQGPLFSNHEDAKQYHARSYNKDQAFRIVGVRLNIIPIEGPSRRNDSPKA